MRLRPPKPARLVENDVESQCLAALRWRRWWPVRLHAGIVKSLDTRRFIKLHDKGMPDYVVVHAKFPAFYLETKRPGKTPSPEQERKHQELRLFGLEVVTVDGYEALITWLNEYERKVQAQWELSTSAPKVSLLNQK